MKLDLNIRRRCISSMTGQAPAAKAAAKTPAPVKRSANAPNAWESQYIDHLRLLVTVKEVRWFEFQPMKLNLGPKLTYTPDFMVVWANGQISFDEVKGFERDDAIAKFKMAAGKFPFIRFRMVKREAGSWTVTRDLNNDWSV